MYYRDAHVALIVYDITSAESYEAALLWMKEVTDYVDNIELMLVGNKCDLEERRKVDFAEVERLASEKRIHSCEVSAKVGN